MSLDIKKPSFQINSFKVTTDTILFYYEIPLFCLCKTARDIYYLAYCYEDLTEAWILAQVNRTTLIDMFQNKIAMSDVFQNAKEVVDNIYEFGLSKLYNKWFDYFSKNYMGKWVKIKLESSIDRGIGEVVDSVVMEVRGMGSAENGFCFCEKKGQPVYYIQSGTNGNFLAVYPVIRLHPGDVIEVNFDDGFLDRIQVVSLDYVQKLRNSKLCMELEDQLGEKND